MTSVEFAVICPDSGPGNDKFIYTGKAVRYLGLVKGKFGAGSRVVATLR